MNENYSKREIDTLMTEIKTSLDRMEISNNRVEAENIASHTKLDENQKKTNGTVTELTKYRERATGAFWAMGIVGTLIIIPLLTWAFITISKIPDKIDTGIKSALSAYDIQVTK